MTICSQNDLNYGGGGHNMIDKASILRCDQETTDEPKTDRREQDDTIKANGRFFGTSGLYFYKMTSCIIHLGLCFLISFSIVNDPVPIPTNFVPLYTSALEIICLLPILMIFPMDLRLVLLTGSKNLVVRMDC